MKRISLTLILLLAIASTQAQEAVGRWRDCLDFSRAHRVELAGDLVYAAAGNGLISIDTYYGNIQRLSKTNLLSDATVATLAYDAGTQCLLVAYENSNIDLIFDNQVYNLSDIKRSDIVGDKNIYSIRFRNGLAYLGTGFGIVVVDVRRHEIRETLYIGTGGTYTTVSALAFSQDSLYAATSEGLKHIALTEPHFGISERWQADTRLAGQTIAMLEWADNQLLAATYTFDPELLTLYTLQASTVTAWNGGRINSMRVGGGRVTVCHQVGVARYDMQLQLVDSTSATPHIELDCLDGITATDGSLWLGHDWAGVVHMPTQADAEYYVPNGPSNANQVYRLVSWQRRTYLCPGGHTTVYAGAFLPPNLFTCVGSEWTSLKRDNGMLNGLFDVVDAAVNPFDTTELVAVLWGGGVASIRNNEVQQLYNTTNTGGALEALNAGSYTTLRTGAVQFDNQGRMWILQSQVGHMLASRQTDGTWRNYSTVNLDPAPEVDKLVWDSLTGYLWFSGRNNVIYVHDGNDRMAKVDPNNGSKLFTDAINAMVQDRSGNLWLGTNKGIKVIYNTYDAFKNGSNGGYSPVVCSNITITNGEFYEYLMAYESITAIAVDGANRKWVGTSTGGVYLISANGLEQLQHFTAENSPLISNKIIALCVQPVTGEVFIGTDKGLQVYRSTATQAQSTPEPQVHIFPNPVRPDYVGPIAIRGLVRDGLVHITDAAGHVVSTTQALGGQAIWNGRTLRGDKVASGVYYIFAADQMGEGRSVGKILIVR